MHFMLIIIIQYLGAVQACLVHEVPSAFLYGGRERDKRGEARNTKDTGFIFFGLWPEIQHDRRHRTTIPLTLVLAFLKLMMR